MKIVFLGGGTGGHFYPLIAVAQQIHRLAEERRLIEPTLIYIGPSPFDMATLQEQNITYYHSPAASMTAYAGKRKNIFSGIRIFFGIVKSFMQLFRIFPDVIFSTGGYAAFPTLFAARILGIPVVAYDADATPGKVSLWSAKFARWIAVAHPDAALQFPEYARPRIVRTGHPIRTEIQHVTAEGGHEFLKLDPARPTILILGGSSGAQVLNNAVIDTLPDLLQKYNIIHQTGKANLDEVVGMAHINNVDIDAHYRAYGLLNALALRMAAGISALVISRAGSGTIFEIASWGIPSIMIPIPEDVSHDQTKNAFSYARAGAAIVMQQSNLTPHLLVAEIDRLFASPESMEQMKVAAQKFSQPDAGRKIARVLLDIILEHTEK